MKADKKVIWKFNMDKVMIIDMATKKLRIKIRLELITVIASSKW